VRLLLDLGVDVHARTTEGLNALCKAAGAGQEAVVRLLLDRGADVYAKDSYG
jgi:ankyrin repeat protein